MRQGNKFMNKFALSIYSITSVGPGSIQTSGYYYNFGYYWLHELYLRITSIYANMMMLKWVNIEKEKWNAKTKQTLEINAIAPMHTHNQRCMRKMLAKQCIVFKLFAQISKRQRYNKCCQILFHGIFIFSAYIIWIVYYEEKLNIRRLKWSIG